MKCPYTMMTKHTHIISHQNLTSAWDIRLRDGNLFFLKIRFILQIGYANFVINCNNVGLIINYVINLTNLTFRYKNLRGKILPKSEANQVLSNDSIQIGIFNDLLGTLKVIKTNRELQNRMQEDDVWSKQLWIVHNLKKKSKILN